MAARFVSTTRLGNIIQMIGLAQQSGILRVMRGHGTGRELGQIRFLGGEPVAALLGQVTANAALQVLLNWGECLYDFDEFGPDDLLAAELESLSGELPYSSMGSGPSAADAAAGSWPPYPYAASSPLPPTSYGGTPSPAPGAASPGVSSLPPTPRESPATQPALQETRLNWLRATPLRTAIAEQVDQLPLDRRERMVLLLVDGQRTVSDLARLTRRNERDVCMVLDHLTQLGLVRGAP